MPKGKPTTAQIIIMASGAVTLIFSFLKFWKFGDDGLSAWGSYFDFSVFPVATLAAIFGLLMAAQIALTVFASVSLPTEIAGFSWKQIHLILGFFSALLMLAYLINPKPDSVDLGIGYFFMLLGSAGLLVGAILLQKDPDTAAAGPGPGTTPPTPF